MAKKRVVRKADIRVEAQHSGDDGWRVVETGFESTVEAQRWIRDTTENKTMNNANLRIVDVKWQGTIAVETVEKRKLVEHGGSDADPQAEA